MKFKHFLSAAVLAMPVALTAQTPIMDTGAEGYLARGRRMYDNRNYVGAIDQLRQVATMPASASMREEAEYYIALSEFERGEKHSLVALRKFVRNHPTSPLAIEAQMKVGNYYFYRGDYTDALAEYSQVRRRALNLNYDEDLVYRMAYCNLRLEDYETAKAQYAWLSNTARYEDASGFYQAYIDYANGDYDKAYNKFAAIDRTGELGYQSQYYMCQIDFAHEQFDKVISLGKSLLSDANNDYFDAELNRIVGESYYRTGNDAQAKVYLEKYLADPQGEPVRTASYVLGVINYREGDYKAALEHLATVTADAKSDAVLQSAYLYSGQSLLQQGKQSDAARAFEKAAGMDYDRGTREAAMFNYATALTKQEAKRNPGNPSTAVLVALINDFPRSEHKSVAEKYLTETYLQGGDYNAALTSLAGIRQPSAQILKVKQQLLYNLGVDAMARGNDKSAQQYFKQAIAVGNYDKATLNNSRLWLGELQYRSGDYTQATSNQQAYANALTQADEGYGMAQYNLGYSLFQQRKYAQARTAFNNAMASGQLSNDLKADAYNRLGDIAYYNNDATAAQANYDKAMAVPSATAKDYSMLQSALMLGMNKQYEKEIAQLDELLSKYPRSSYAAQAMLEKGNAYVALDKSDKAIEAFNALIKAYPKAGEARKGMLQMAIVQKNHGDINAAMASYKDVIRKYPTSDEAQAAVEDMKLLSADRGELKEFERFLATVPNAPSIDVSEADRLNFEAAEKDAISSTPSIVKMQEYLDKNPNGAYTAKAKYYIGRYHYEKGQYSEALKWTNEALQAKGNSSFAEDALAIKSDALVKLGRKQEALASYKELASKATTADNRIVAQLGAMRVAKELGRWSDVKQYADALLRESLSSQEKSEVQVAAAIANAHLGNSAAAKSQLEKLAANPETEAGAQAAYELALMQYNAGQTAAAERTINKLVEKGTPQAYWLAKSFILLSDIYHKQGKTTKAREYLESLRNNYPGKEKEIFNEIDTRLNKWGGKSSSSKATAKAKAEEKPASTKKTTEKTAATAKNNASATSKKASEKDKKTTKAASQPTTHVIKNGESLSSIAAKYGVSVSALRKANGISGDKIQTGDKLTIPANKK